MLRVVLNSVFVCWWVLCDRDIIVLIPLLEGGEEAYGIIMYRMLRELKGFLIDQLK